MQALPPGQALRLLAGTPIGRVVFTQHALPAIRPVNHIVHQGDIIIRSHDGADLVNAANASGSVGVVVAYEADEIDPTSRTGWSVVVTGYATLVTDPEELADYATLLRPWTDHTMDRTIRIHPEIVTGFRLGT
nr:pyridoxamine 5'-phosphate oxidase family protein [Streptacidiphilus melanogenes]